MKYLLFKITEFIICDQHGPFQSFLLVILRDFHPYWYHIDCSVWKIGTSDHLADSFLFVSLWKIPLRKLCLSSSDHVWTHSVNRLMRHLNWLSGRPSSLHRVSMIAGAPLAAPPLLPNPWTCNTGRKSPRSISLHSPKHCNMYNM